MNFFTIILFSISLVAGVFISILVRAKQQRESSQLDWLEAIFVSIIGMVILVGWSGVLLASFGVFSLPTITVILFLFVGGMILWKRPFSFPKFEPITYHEVFLLIFLVGCAIVYFRPHEYVLGSNDAGSYINIGTTLAHTGEFIVQNDEWTAWLRQFPEITLRQQPSKWRTEYLQFVGWYIDDTDASRIIPQFFPFHPTLLAVGISLGGLMGGLLVTPLWAVLDLLVVYLLTRRLFDRNVALLATVLLAITAVFIYFARYPTTEPLTLLLVFTGLLSWQTLWDDSRASSLWGVLGGAAFGAALLTRIDLPLVALLIYGWLILVWLQGKWNRNWSIFTATLSLFSIHALVSAFFLSWPYVWNTYGSLFGLFKNKPWLSFSAISASVGALSLIFLIWRKGWDNFNQGNWGQVARSSWFRWLLSASIISLSIYAYFIRPLLEPARSYATWPSGTMAWVLDGQNWVRMGWYITPLGILATTLGLAWILRRESLNRFGLFLSVGVLTTVQYVFKIFNTPYHIYTMRRYVPIVLPVLMIFAAYFLVSLFFVQKKRMGRIMAVILTILLISGILYQSRFVLSQRDYIGVVEQITTLNKQLDPQAIIIINAPSEQLFADQIGVPLRFNFNHDIATIRSGNKELQPFLDDLITYAAEQKRPLQLIAINQIDPVIRRTLSLQPATIVPITLTTLENTFFEFPSTFKTIYYGIEIYNIQNDTLTQNNDLVIDIGTLDTLYITEGFYHKERRSEDITTRWTSGDAVLELPLDNRETITINIQAMTYRPDIIPIAPVTVYLDNLEVGQFTPDKNWKTYTFSAQPSPTNGISELRFTTKTFNPANLQISKDTRDLGFLMDWVQIE